MIKTEEIAVARQVEMLHGGLEVLELMVVE